MIVKHKERDYRNIDVWGYIDKVSQVSIKEIDSEIYVKMYDELPQLDSKDSIDNAEYMDGKRLTQDIIYINKIFMIASKEVKEELTGNTHCENLIFDFDAGLPIYSILLYVEDSKEFDNILLVTDQPTYLLNDEGKTIERLV